jgi:hypothetical protein
VGSRDGMWSRKMAAMEGTGGFYSAGREKYWRGGWVRRVVEKGEGTDGAVRGKAAEGGGSGGHGAQAVEPGHSRAAHGSRG